MTKPGTSFAGLKFRSVVGGHSDGQDSLTYRRSSSSCTTSATALGLPRPKAQPEGACLRSPAATAGRGPIGFNEVFGSSWDESSDKEVNRIDEKEYEDLLGRCNAVISVMHYVMHLGLMV